MSNVSHKICDRCGRRITDKFPITKIERIKTIKLFGFGPYDYSDHKLEFCKACTADFDQFLENGSTKRSEIEEINT